MLERLDFIAMGQIAGFGLEEIAVMFAADGRLQVDRKLLLQKASELEKDMKQLGAIRNTLEHVANCSAPDHLAGKRQSKIRNKSKKKSKKQGAIK